MDRELNSFDQAVVRYERTGRTPALQNSRLYSQYEQIGPYQKPSAAQPPMLFPQQNEGAFIKNPKLQQNVAAVLDYNNIDKTKVIVGRQASALAQIHQNDLHNLENIQVLVRPGQNGVHDEFSVANADRSKNYIRRHLDLQNRFSHAQHTSEKSQYPESDLITSFDPMKDRHMWTMWRTAVNGRIVDEVRQLEMKKSRIGAFPSPDFDASIPGMYGKALVAPPLKRFIKFGDERSRAVAVQMSSGLGHGSLETSQFVYYGLPRVYVQRLRK